MGHFMMNLELGIGIEGLATCFTTDLGIAMMKDFVTEQLFMVGKRGITFITQQMFQFGGMYLSLVLSQFDLGVKCLATLLTIEDRHYYYAVPM